MYSTAKLARHIAVTMELFHYTDESGYQSIWKDNEILPSKSGKYGPGVYLTDLNPSEFERPEIAKKLYERGAHRKLRLGRLKYYIKVEIPVQDLHCERDHVYRYDTGIPLNLNRIKVQSQGTIDEWKFMAVSGTVAAGAATIIIAEKMYKHSTDGRQSRAADIRIRLELFLKKHNFDSSFEVRKTQDGSCARIYCCACQSPVSPEYDGGYLFADSIDRRGLLNTLNMHGCVMLRFLMAMMVVIVLPIALLNGHMAYGVVVVAMMVVLA